MNPTPEQLAKLPKWAREHISDLAWKLATAEQSIVDASDSQTESPFYYEDYSGIPHRSVSRKYIQAYGGVVYVKHGGVELSVRAVVKGDGQRDYGIELQWGTDGHRGMMGHVAFIPKSWQTASIISKENMR